MTYVTALAARFSHGSANVGDTFGDAVAMPARIKSGFAITVRKGIAHSVAEAILSTDGTRSILAARWECGGGTANAIPISAEDQRRIVSCVHCPQAAKFAKGPSVYRCWDADEELLYIGSSVNVYNRIRQHRYHTPWWSEVARVEAVGYLTEAAARLNETLAIREECPAYNRDANVLLLPGTRVTA